MPLFNAMGRTNGLVFLLLIFSIMAWYQFSYRPSHDVKDNHVLEFEYEPTERFNLDSKWSWALTILILVITSVFISN
ncbi:putative thioredoxin protein [Clavispora lusitaniae]|uniref:Thioredoxin protein n=1 Tax=Clavispora lusitaniae TaxID=36911 RepID=A0ACD0WM51_CLALS|nr:putative integral membrane protein [Clavispora lusitaniae]QFZ28291.1 putative thioredoxin protein [Clavispora lusitaniae]QFZ33954.1 putative thioredoxin protein [Clavispora lusitaniae]QFZ39638.1 putative thioredoxin protein [Clavispora lusitaniae]QFZ45320.1 putative thioredoxin protein [Clavispora lusitaniae]